jgi:hypothetical protein
MTEQRFKDWLNKLKEVWETKNPNAVVNLCAEKFVWYETPFDKPFTTKEQLLKDWQGILNQENIVVSFEILSVKRNLGIAKWRAAFIRLPSKEKTELDGVFQISLDENGQCVEFRQWYNSRKIS